MSRLAVALCLSLATAVATLPARPARADEDAEDAAAKKSARKHFKKGEKLFALSRFEEALAEYQAAFEAYPAPEFLFNIGQCHRNLGAYDKAIFSFKKYLRLQPDAENREAVEKLIAELEDERAQARADAKRRRRTQLEPIPRGDGRDDLPPAGGGAPLLWIGTRWWFWTGVVVVGGAATAYALTRDPGGLPESDLGNLDFPQ